MLPARALIDVTGTGCFEAMKGVMSRRVEESHNRIFRDSANEVKKSLLEMISTNNETIHTKIKEVFSALSKDYSSCLDESRLASIDERLFKAEVAKFLQGVTLFPKLDVRDAGPSAKTEPIDTDMKVKTEPTV